jgi:4-hydroxy-tetrahydrodipicolinate synthase
MNHRLSRRELVRSVAAAGLSGTFRDAAAKREPDLRGLFPIMATPYTKSKQVDWEDLAREVDFLNRCGVPGMAWPQLFGETSKLTPDERKRGMEVIAKAGKAGKAAIVLGVDGPNIKAALGYLEAAEALDPDALIALPPSEATTLDQVMDYYRTLVRATKRPFFIQNADIKNGVLPPVEPFIELAREYPHCGYFKEEIEPQIPRMLKLAQNRPPVKRVFAGDGGKNFMYVMRLGLDGVMAGNAYADVFVQVWDLYHAGEKEKAHDLFAKIAALLLCEGYLPGTRQYIMMKRGVFKTMVSRREEYKLTPEGMKEVEFQFEGLRPYLRA